MTSEMEIILASASPRRLELMKELTDQFTVRPADVNEEIPENTPPHLACMFNAFKKAMAAVSDDANVIAIGADTIVYSEKILGKPADEQDAFETLQSLRGKTHQVFTGVSLVSGDGSIRRAFYDCTDVTFENYSDDSIREYIDTKECMDKAGSYAIQGVWSQKVSETKGSISNVIGLPVEKLKEELLAVGILTDERK